MSTCIYIYIIYRIHGRGVGSQCLSALDVHNKHITTPHNTSCNYNILTGNSPTALKQRCYSKSMSWCLNTLRLDANGTNPTRINQNTRNILSSCRNRRYILVAVRTLLQEHCCKNRKKPTRYKNTKKPTR